MRYSSVIPLDSRSGVARKWLQNLHEKTLCVQAEYCLDVKDKGAFEKEEDLHLVEEMEFVIVREKVGFLWRRRSCINREMFFFQRRRRRIRFASWRRSGRIRFGSRLDSCEVVYQFVPLHFWGPAGP